MKYITKRKYNIKEIIKGYKLTIFQELDTNGNEQYTVDEILNAGLDLYEKRKFTKVIKLLNETGIRELSFKLQYIDVQETYINTLFCFYDSKPVTWNLTFTLKRLDDESIEDSEIEIHEQCKEVLNTKIGKLRTIPWKNKLKE